jgi:hypothetical protein
MTGAGASRPSQVSCPQCGTQVERGKHPLCPECGFPFNWVDPPPPDTGQHDADMAHTPDETGTTTQPHPPPPPPPVPTAPPPPRRPTEPAPQVPMVTCPVCQTANPSTRTFCQHCGTQLTAPAPAARPPATPSRLRSRLPRSGRGWLVVLAAIVLPVAAYVGAVQLLSEDPPVGTTPRPTVVETGPPTTARARCPGGFTEPKRDTPTRLAPLGAIRTHMGWTDLFVIAEMRTWRESDGLRRWYVKARQRGDASRRGRWLVEQQEDGQRLVLASAPFGTKGFAAGDWQVVDGQKLPSGTAGCLAGT